MILKSLNRKWILFFSIAIVLLTSTLLFSFKRKTIQVRSLVDTVGELRVAYNLYLSMTPEQLHDVWNKRFNDVEYRLGSKGWKEFDCSSAETEFWRILGANVLYGNVYEKEDLLKKFSGPCKSIKEVKPGWIIVFKKLENMGHIGVVEKTISRNKLKYMDVNIGDDGQGFKTIAFDDYRIQAIYPMSFDYWCGDVLNKFDKR